MKYLLFISLATLLYLHAPVTSAFANQASAIEEKKPLSDYLIRHWRTRDGLPHNSVNEIIQDDKGYLWLATWQGPARFNGRRFDIYDNLRETGLPDIGMYTAAYSHCDGSVYVAGSRGGIARFYDGRWKTLQSAPPFVNHLSIDKNCNLWVSTSELGLLVYKNNQPTAQFTTEHGLNSMFVYESIIDSQGNLWAATNKGVQVKKAGQAHFQAITTIPEQLITALFEVENGSLLIGTEQGLYQQKNNKMEFERILPEINSRISTLFQSPNNGLWLGTYRDGLIRIGNYGIERFGTEHGLPNNHVLDIIQDKEGSFWVSTHGGLVQFRNALFSTYTTDDGLTGNYIRALAENKNGDVIVGSSNGAAIINKSGITPLAPDTPLTKQSVLSLAYDHKQQLHIGTYTDGLYIWDGAQIVHHFDDDNLLKTDEVRQLALDPELGIFLATPLGITHLYQNSEETWKAQYIAQKDGLTNNYTTSLYLDQQGTLWAGSARGVVNIKITQKNEQFDYQINEVDLTELNNAELAFHITGQSGYIWMATDRGLIVHHLKNSSWQIFNRDQGLPFDNFMSVTFDGDGNLWLGSNRGPVMVEHDSFTQVLEGHADKLNVQHFSEVDGLESAQINSGGPSMLQSQTGSIWLATSNGVSEVDPKTMSKIGNRPPDVNIESVKADGATVVFGEQLSAETERIVFEFIAPGYLMAEQINYQVRLVGFDKGWVNKSSLNSAEYTTLPANDYIFRVRARYPGGQWSQPDHFAFRQSAHFWMQPWFWIFALLIVALLILISVRARLNQHNRTRLRLEQMVKEKTADLETAARQDPLTTLGNRRAFDERLQHELSRSRRDGTYLSLAILDVDYFKQVNDTYLHTVGDQVLIRLAEVLRDEIRDIDYVARWGGEEFAVLITNSELEVAKEASERMRERIAATSFDDLVDDMKITVSIGVASSYHYADYAGLLVAADQALYQAKHSGRNRIESKP
ncbi:ligand-binding sensor domain-containing diguanylate cyclase [Idiomarina aminovorans]|uniref:ligand-binding sensor domain-containing diguanylate cyclase n=1 Tax=Idiomarina aminovorans TaxID=2914829 RepID=UPI002002F0D6|nr:ligand-binding sensor domain-containing diguanylate cyclase [Idiomarina sp. ATCH4]MCK7458398.1 diguanylate cyclase [Idiomarina sp. ATCH4]